MVPSQGELPIIDVYTIDVENNVIDTFSIPLLPIGTAPLNGERAQRDFPRPTSWTLGHVGIRQGSGTGSSSSLQLDPRCRSDLVANQFRNTPEMVGQTTGHRWCLSKWALSFSCCSCAKCLMETAKVVGTANQVHARLKRLEPL